MSELGRLHHQLVRARLEHLHGKRLQVRFAPEMKAHPKLPAVATIAKRLREGEPLWPYLSKKTRKANFDDPLLNHWGIVHFHLGESFEKSGHIERTGPLLYAWIDERNSKAYLLDILPGHMMADERIVNVLVRNWPHLLAPYEIQGGVHHGTDVPEMAKDGRMNGFSRSMLIHPAPSMSAGQTTALRKAGVTPTFEAENGVRYSPPGGGASCAGTGAYARTHADHEWYWAKHVATTIEANVDSLCDQIEAVRSLNVEKLDFRLETLEGLRAALAVESSVRARLKLPLVFDYDLDPAKLIAPMVAAAAAVR